MTRPVVSSIAPFFIVADMAATLSFYRGKTKSFESTPVRLDSFLPKRGQTLPVEFQAPLAQHLRVQRLRDYR